jgi:GAF domain-containing protein
MRRHTKDPRFTPERVERLVEFTNDVVTAAVRMRDRVAVVHRLLPLASEPIVMDRIALTMAEARAVYPGHNVDVNLMAEREEVRLSDRDTEVIKIDTEVPEGDTWCRFTVAANKPVEVLDSLKDLVVCRSPYSGMVRSYMGHPLTVRGWPVGVFCVYSPTPKRSFSAHDRERLARWAGEVSDALSSALALADT